jgi:hypothetical protein
MFGVFVCLVGLRIEISNHFLEDFERVAALVKYINNKPPLQEGDYSLFRNLPPYPPRNRTAAEAESRPK